MKVKKGDKMVKKISLFCIAVVAACVLLAQPGFADVGKRAGCIRRRSCKKACFVLSGFVKKAGPLIESLCNINLVKVHQKSLN